MTISVDRVLSLISLDQSTGRLYWRYNRGGSARAGSIAGTLNKNGYRVITIDRKRYMAHHIVWLIHTGQLPALLIDHKDLNKDNNCFPNLRIATKQLNAANTRHHVDSKTGVKGVFRSQTKGKWRAQIGFDGRVVHLGTFETKEAARIAYQSAAEGLFGQFARAS